MRQTCSLSSLTFKKVTRGSAIKSHFPSPLLPQVGVAGRLEQTNLGNMEKVPRTEVPRAGWVLFTKRKLKKNIVSTYLSISQHFFLFQVKTEIFLHDGTIKVSS